MNKEEIIKAIEEMTVAELADLVKELEDKFGVSAAAPVAVAAAPVGGASSGSEDEEKSSFDILLKEIGDKKLQVIKTVKEITGLGLKEAKNLVDKAGSPESVVKKDANKEDAEQIKAKLEEAGATVELK